MLHGRVVRPPYAGVDAGDFVGTSLIAVDEASVRDIPGPDRRRQDRRLRRRRRRARGKRDQGGGASSKLTWKPMPTLPDLKDIETALRANPSTPRTLIDKGDVDAAHRRGRKPMRGPMSGPTRCTRSIGPSCAVADFREDQRSGVVRHAKSAHAARRSGAAGAAAGSRDRGDPDGGGRLLWPQLRRRRLRRCGAAVARGRPSGPGATDARTGTRLGAEGHRATDGRQRRTWTPTAASRLTILRRAIRPTARRRWRCCSPARSRRCRP